MLVIEMDPESILAQGGAGTDISLHCAAVVIIDSADCFVFSVMCMATENNIAPLFVSISCSTFGNRIDCPSVMLATVL